MECGHSLSEVIVFDIYWRCHRKGFVDIKCVAISVDWDRESSRYYSTSQRRHTAKIRGG